MRFFFDACLSPHLVVSIAGLRRPGETYEVVGLRSRWPDSVPDLEWIPALAREAGWIIISGDERIAKRGPERLAWMESKLTAFFLIDDFASRRLNEQLAALATWWPRSCAWRRLLRLARATSSGRTPSDRSTATGPGNTPRGAQVGGFDWSPTQVYWASQAQGRVAPEGMYPMCSL